MLEHYIRDKFIRKSYLKAIALAFPSPRTCAFVRYAHDGAQTQLGFRLPALDGGECIGIGIGVRIVIDAGGRRLGASKGQLKVYCVGQVAC